jgi:hypothetical protein
MIAVEAASPQNSIQLVHVYKTKGIGSFSIHQNDIYETPSSTNVTLLLSMLLPR